MAVEPSTDRDLLEKFTRISGEIKRRTDRALYEGSLSAFVEAAWPFFDGSSQYQQSWALDALCDHLTAVTKGDIKRLLINFPPRGGKSSVASIAWPAWTWVQQQRSYTSGPQVQFLCASYGHSLSLQLSNKSRRLLLSPFFQRHWGDRFELRGDQNAKHQYDNSEGGSRIATSVTGGLLGIGGAILIADDLHNTEQVESEAERETVLRFWREFRSTRLNDPKQAAIVAVMQRLHDEDVSGTILQDTEEWTHLCLPMRHDPARHCVTVLKWAQDGRALQKWEDPRDPEGRDLLWPERFGEPQVRMIEKELGPYMCTPAESPVLMGDLSLRPISLVKPGDIVVGFTTDTGREVNSSVSYRRRHLCHAKVKAVTSLRAPVVRVTLSSGEIIRCTPDHRWYMGKRGGRRGKNDVRPLYRPAKVGRELMRVCPPHLPELSGDDLRLAGWLSGFFDGEGTVALCAKNDERYRKSTTIKFFQGTGRNKPLCDLLEQALFHFGFKFYCYDGIRSDRRVKTAQHRNRVYTLEGETGVPLYQRFLHIVRPHKWVDRIISGALGTKWINGKERVISIEPDGEEQVYALETETGNYVVWGLASANSSGRLQQSPTPLGGGIIKREWWQPWEAKDGKFPTCEYRWASADTAYTEKEENDPTGFTCWGLWYDKGQPKVILLNAWRKRLEIHGPNEWTDESGKRQRIERLPKESELQWVKRTQDTWGLCEWLAYSCRRFQVHDLLIEGKASGLSVAQELRRLHGNEGWGIHAVTPEGDKVARLYAVQPTFAAGLVYYVDRDWSNMVIDEISVAPRGRYMDLTDSASQALAFVRNRGMLKRPEERIAEEMFLAQHRAPSASQPLYPA